MIVVIGAVIGIGLGLLFRWLQQQYGFVRLGDSEGSFIVDAYPVSVHYTDVAIIFVNGHRRGLAFSLASGKGH